MPVLLESMSVAACKCVVSTRLTKGKKELQFYPFVQLPQQPKQLLICSGVVNQYFKIARCFSDEDGRKDRLLDL